MPDSFSSQAAQEAFEAYHKQRFPQMLGTLNAGENLSTLLRDYWLTAHQQGRVEEREACAKLVEHHVNGSGPIRQQLADAIRGRVGIRK